MSWFACARGNRGEISTEVLVVWPDWGRKGFELRVDMAVSDVRDQWRRLLVLSGIEFSISRKSVAVLNGDTMLCLRT